MAGDDGLCGPAVLSMMLARAGVAASPAALAPDVYLPGRNGSLQAEMLAATRRHRRPAVPLADGWPALTAELAAGLPVAALVNLSLPVWPRWHYFVVTAVDPADGRVRVHSGDRADDWWSTTTFESVWARSGRWAFVVPPPGVLPASAGEAPVLQALLALDHAVPGGAAAPWWAAAEQRWPRSLTAAVGAAQSQAESGDRAGAITRLTLATGRLDRAVLWNNLAVLLAAEGRGADAQAAARRALARAEADEPDWLPTVRATLAEVQGPPGAPGR